MDNTTVRKLAKDLHKLSDGPHPTGYTDKERARMEKIQKRLAVEFGLRRNWALMPNPYEAIRELFPWPIESPVDHPYSYRMPDGRYAIASHVYDCDQEEIAANRVLAAERNLTVEYPTDFPSWWYPGHTKLAVWRPSA
jgi:hypothetical protein